MISYFIAAHCVFTTNFSSKCKSQFQVIFGQDSFPLKLSPFQASLSQNSPDCLFTNGWCNVCNTWNTWIPFSMTLFIKTFPILSCKLLVCFKMFLFCRTVSFGGLPFYSFVTAKSPILFFICLQMVIFEYSQ